MEVVELIDVHVHISMNILRDNRVNADYVIQRMDKYGISKSIVFSAVDGIKDNNVSMFNDFVLSECENYCERLVPYYFFLPSYDGCVKELVNENKWKGIKMHPNDRGFFDSHNTRLIIDIVRKKGLPMLVHSDMKLGVFDEIVEYLSFIDTNIGVCHAFHMDKEYIQRVSKMENVFLDVSPWIHMMRCEESFLVPKERRPRWFDENNAINNLINLFEEMNGRLIWGTDMPDDHPLAFGMECGILQHLPEKIYGKIVENAYLFV